MRPVPFLVILVTLHAAAMTRAAERPTFPYETVVDADDALVRSGPGSKYYPTVRLKRGDRVTVQRHDPGGWYMIVPPRGSFSWVPAKYVQKQGTDRGTVSAENVVVRVGSDESDIRELFQRKLAQGDEVRILGEKQLAPESGSGPAELWYRITPPAGEWRWVNGQALAPFGSAAAAIESLATSNPQRTTVHRAPAEQAEEFLPPVSATDESTPSDKSAREPREGSDPFQELRDRPIIRRQHVAAGSPAPGTKGASATGLDSQLELLDRLDERFRSILDRDPLEWDFTELKEDYRQLRDEVAGGQLRQMIDSRLLRLADYEKTREKHEQLERVSQETLQRDTELSEVQKQHEAQATALQKPRFDGAGIVARAALQRPGMPKYVLLAPTGRVLAYLVPTPGVQLENWIGRSAGIFGRRTPSPELRADLITVVRLAPVRLAQ